MPHHRRAGLGDLEVGLAWWRDWMDCQFCGNFCGLRQCGVRFHVIGVGAHSLPQPPRSPGSRDNYPLQSSGPVVLLGLCRWRGH